MRGSTEDAVCLSLQKKDPAAAPHVLWAGWFCCLTLCMAGAARVLAAELGGGGFTCLAAVLRCLGQDQCFPDGRINWRPDPPQFPKVNLTVCIDFSCFSLKAGLGLLNPSFGSQFKLLLLIAVRTWSGPVRDSICHCFHLQLYHFLRLLGFFFIFDSQYSLSYFLN